MNFFYNKKRLLVKIGIILILILIIMLPIYFLVIKKSTSSNTPLSLNTSVIVNDLEDNEEETSLTIKPSTLGFCFVSTKNGIDLPTEFLPKSLWVFDVWTSLFYNADNGNRGQYDELNKWAYDSNNTLNIVRTINNTNNAYSQTELDALGKTSTANKYLVNKLIPNYKSDNPYLTNGAQMRIKPWTLSAYSNCK